MRGTRARPFELLDPLDRFRRQAGANSAALGASKYLPALDWFDRFADDD